MHKSMQCRFTRSIMRSNNTSVQRCDTRVEDDPPPTLLLHVREAKLRKEEWRTRVDAPCAFESLDGDVSEGGDVLQTACGAGVGEEDLLQWLSVVMNSSGEVVVDTYINSLSQTVYDFFMQFSYFIVT